jgi:hypothetical protein
LEYELKKGKYEELEGEGLKSIMEEVFGTVTREGDLYVTSYGALKRLEAKLVGKSALYVSTESDTSVQEAVGVETIKRFNQFLERATGYTAKERKNRLQKKAREGKL